MTVWHYVKDLRATLNFAIKAGLLDQNPVSKADLSALARRRAPKAPLSRAVVEKQAMVLTGRDRLYFDTLRFMGLRKNEGNQVRGEDVIEAEGLWLHVRGTKTAGSDRWLPIPPSLWEGFSNLAPGYLFGTRKGKPIYDRRKLFARAARDSGTPVLKPKDLRDYFASSIDPTTAKNMLGHTSLSTTAIYARGVQERMLEAVKELGCQKSLTSNGRPPVASADGGPYVQFSTKDSSAPAISATSAGCSNGLGANNGGQPEAPLVAKPCDSVHHPSEPPPVNS